MTDIFIPVLIAISPVAGATALWYTIRSIQKDFERETVARWYESEKTLRR
jgi:hypothetical protein